MADIADMGFKVDTSDLDKAVTKLNAIPAAAAGVSAAAIKMTKTAEAAGAATAAAATAAARAEVAQSTALVKKLQLSGKSAKEELTAARAAQVNAKATLAAVVADEKRVQSLIKEAAALRKTEAAAMAAAAAQNASAAAMTRPALAVNNGPTIARDERPNKFNTANIAAQFQDIGVTAAMGMNPLLIAIQQGTQLSAILSSMEKPAAGLAEAFKQVFSSTALLTIGIVAVAAALLQFVNWTSIAQGALNGLATVIQTTTPYVLGLGAALAVIYSRTIIAGIVSLSTTLVTLGATALAAGAKMAAAWVIGMGPVGWAILGIAALTAAFEAFGFNALSVVKTAANGIIASFVGAFNAIKSVFGKLPAVMGAIMINTANMVLGTIERMVNGSIQLINGLMDALPESLRPEGGRITWQADVQIDNPFMEEAAAAGKTAGEEFAKAFQMDYVGAAGEYAQNLANSAAAGIRKFSDTLDDEKEKKKRGKTEAERYEDIIKGAERRIASLEAERQAIGMTEQAAARLKYQTDLLNEAQQKNINLSPMQRAKLMELGAGMAEIEEQTRRTRNAYDFLKDTSSGFFQDMKSGLQEGKSLWESFGNAVSNIADKIANKFLDLSVNSLFQGLGATETGGGFISSIAGLFAAKGHAFNDNGVVPFAKGGAFTNSLVNKATPFTFASGGAFGVMGEAGPEAVMPLHRGPDGSLGVKSNGMGGGTPVIVNVINNSDSKASVQQRQSSSGMEIEVLIDDMMSQKISQPGSATNRSLQARDSRQLIQRG
jgi:hypothetical protein